MTGSTIIPSARYQDAHAAIKWLCDVLGFTERAVYEGPDGTVAHAELTLGGGMFMLGSASNANPSPEYWGNPADFGGHVTSPFYVVAADCKAIYERAQTAGAAIVTELKTMDYGGAAFSVRDPEGYLWSVGEYDPWAVQAAE